MSTTTWKNVPGHVLVESEVEIKFLSSGSYTSMSMYGGADHTGWPEERDEERLLHKVLLTFPGCNLTVELDAKQAESVFDYFHQEVEKADLEEQEP